MGVVQRDIKYLGNLKYKWKASNIVETEYEVNHKLISLQKKKRGDGCVPTNPICRWPKVERDSKYNRQEDKFSE